MPVGKIAILYKTDPLVNPPELLPEHEEAIRKAAPGAEVIRAYEESELLQKQSDCDVLVTWGMYRPGRFVAAARSLKWIHSLSAGVDGLVAVPEISGPRLRLTSTKGVHGLGTAEHTLCLMLMFMRGFHVLADRQRRKQWQRYAHIDQLEGKTVGIVGLGEIGQAVAHKCKLLGMRVVASRFRLVQSDKVQSGDVDRLFAAHELISLLQESDFVVLTLPLTPATYHLIGQEQLRSMKQNAYLLNVARGNIVDELALTQALQEGWIAGAGLDCFEAEPLPATSELWDLPNVIISPHMAAALPRYMDRAIKVCCENLTRFNEGRELLYEFDWDAGY